MRADQTCEIVRDLLPSVNEGLTSEKTTKWVMEHLDTCPECKEKYDILHAVDPAELDKPAKSEIDRDVKYLKKVKNRLFLKILATVLCICTILAAGYYFLFVKVYYVPVSGMSVEVIEQEIPDGPCIYDITLKEAYAVAVKEEEEIYDGTGNEEPYHFDHIIRYSYSLWDYLFSDKKTRTEQVQISSDFVGDALPGMSILDTPARIILGGTSEGDSKVLWSSMKLVPAAKAILERFITSDVAYDPSRTANLKAVSETTEIILGAPGENVLGYNITYSFFDGTSTEQMMLRDIFILLRNMNLSDNDMDTMRDAAVLYVSTAKTTAAEISNNDTNAPEEEILIRRIGLYVLPHVEMEAEPIILNLYIGNEYNFCLKDGKWQFENEEGALTFNEGDYITLPIDSGD